MTPQRAPVAKPDDGRYAAQYAADHCVCAYCWGVLTQQYDEDDRRWYAVCAANPAHLGFHHKVFKEMTIDAHGFEAMEVQDFYSRTPFAEELGYAKPLSGQELIDHVQKMKRMLGRDDSGL